MMGKCNGWYIDMAFNTVHLLLADEQTSKQASKRTNKQTNKQINKQTNKQTKNQPNNQATITLVYLCRNISKGCRQQSDPHRSVGSYEEPDKGRPPSTKKHSRRKSPGPQDLKLSTPRKATGNEYVAQWPAFFSHVSTCESWTGREAKKKQEGDGRQESSQRSHLPVLARDPSAHGSAE